MFAIKMFVVAVLFFAVGSASYAESYADVSSLLAANLQLHLYPIEKGKLTRKKEAELGLRPYALPHDSLFFNYQRDGKFALTLLKAETLVLVDEEGIPRYQESCGNRLIDPRELKTPAPKSEIGDAFPAPKPPVANLPAPSTPFWDSAGAWVEKLPKPAQLLAHGLGWMLALGLLVAAGLLAIGGLSALFRRLRA